MDPAGMVHALDIIRQLLRGDGLLIDIRPTGQPPEIILSSEGVDYPIGHLEETDNFVEYQQAEEAIQEVLRAGWFALLERRPLIFNTYALSFAELRSFLEANWSDIIFPLAITARAEAVERQASRPVQVRLREQAWIGSLKKKS